MIAAAGEELASDSLPKLEIKTAASVLDNLLGKLMIAPPTSSARPGES